MERMQYKMERMKDRMERARLRVRPALERQPRLRRIPHWKRCGGWRKSRREFKDFLDRLRHAKDKEEFDQFMAQHRPRPTPPRTASPKPESHRLKPQA